MKRLRFAVIMILVFFISFSLSAADIVARGTGSTRVESRNNAGLNLTRYINGEFLQSSNYLISREDSLETYYDSFSSTDEIGTEGDGSAVVSTTSSSYIDYLSETATETRNLSTAAYVVYGFLSAVEYDDQENADGTWTSVATIRDLPETINAFVMRLRNTANTIGSLWNSYNPEESNDVRKNTLRQLYAALIEYESYSQLMVFMDHGDLTPSLSVPITSASVFTEYQNIVIAEGYELEERSRTITDEGDYRAVLQEITRNRQEQRQLEREKADSDKARDEMARRALEERLRQTRTIMLDDASDISTDNMVFTTLYDDYFNMYDVFADACKTFDSLCREEFSRLDNDFEAEVVALRNRPYRDAELKNGRVLASVKKTRNEEYDYLFMQNEFRKANALKTIKDGLFELILGKYNNVISAVEKLDNKTFEIHLDPESSPNLLSFMFDSNSSTWTLVFRNLEFMDGVATSGACEVLISYEDLFNKKPVSPKMRYDEAYDDYLSYLDDIDYLNTLLLDYDDYFSTSIRFTVHFYEILPVGFNKITLNNIQFIIESNALPDNPDFVAVKLSTPSSRTINLDWEMPGYSKALGEVLLAETR